jgi:hypothetical protein
VSEPLFYPEEMSDEAIEYALSHGICPEDISLDEPDPPVEDDFFDDTWFEE